MHKAVLKSAFLFFVCMQLSCSDKKPVITSSTGTSVIIKGRYNGNNIYVKNPVSPEGLGYCINEVLINGNRTSDEILNEETFEVDLKASGIREGNDITIEIRHYKGCEPKVLNPEVLN